MSLCQTSDGTIITKLFFPIDEIKTVFGKEVFSCKWRLSILFKPYSIKIKIHSKTPHVDYTLNKTCRQLSIAINMAVDYFLLTNPLFVSVWAILKRWAYFVSCGQLLMGVILILFEIYWYFFVFFLLFFNYRLNL